MRQKSILRTSQATAGITVSCVERLAMSDAQTLAAGGQTPQQQQQQQHYARYRNTTNITNAPKLTATQLRRAPSQQDIHMLMSSSALIGTLRVSNHMQPYMFPRDTMIRLLKSQYEREKVRHAHNLQAGRRVARLAPPPQIDTLESTFDLRALWNQLNLAAMLVAGVSNLSQILVVASNPRAANGANYLALVLGARVCIGRYVPGTITNTNQKTFCEPPFIILASATEDTQAIKESSRSNAPIIAFADSTSNLEHVDVPIPCNTRGRLSIGLMMYLLARQIQRHRGVIPYDGDLENNITPDHFVQQKTNRQESIVSSAEASGQQYASSAALDDLNQINPHESQREFKSANYAADDYAQFNATAADPAAQPTGLGMKDSDAPTGW